MVKRNQSNLSNPIIKNKPTITITNREEIKNSTPQENKKNHSKNKIKIETINPNHKNLTNQSHNRSLRKIPSSGFALISMNNNPLAIKITTRRRS
jgi:hypothetical protein